MDARELKDLDTKSLELRLLVLKAERQAIKNELYRRAIERG
jgi:hypothetical protein